MKLMNKILVLAISSSLVLLTHAQTTMTNGTGCLVLQPSGQLMYGKPVTAYVFLRTKDASGNYYLKYSGVSVEPGQTNVVIPTTIAPPPPATPPGSQSILLGADPHDAPGHVTELVAQNLDGQYLAVQSVFSDGTPQSLLFNCGNPNYPCVGVAIGSSQTASKCTTFLSQSKPTALPLS